MVVLKITLDNNCIITLDENEANTPHIQELNSLHKEDICRQEAQNRLGMTYSALRNQVDAGNIRSITPPGERQAVYPKEDVDRLAHEWKPSLQPNSPPLPSSEKQPRKTCRSASP